MRPFQKSKIESEEIKNDKHERNRKGSGEV